MAILSDISASLRGELPMVRVKIVVLLTEKADTAISGAVTSGCGGVSYAAASAPAAAAAGGGNGGSTFSLATLGSRAKAALLNQPPQQQQQPSQQQPSVSHEESAEGGQSKKGAALLSRFVWGRKASVEEDTSSTASAATVGAAAAMLPVAAVASSTASSAAVSQVTIPVTSGGSGGCFSTGKRVLGEVGRGGDGRLVRLHLTIATQGVNLDIKSPHRKSRRTPSHEAIEMMAGKRGDSEGAGSRNALSWQKLVASLRSPRGPARPGPVLCCGAVSDVYGRKDRQCRNRA